MLPRSSNSLGMDTNYRLMQEKCQEFDGAGYFKRMDEDRKLAILDPYIMRNLDGTQTPDVINVTMNEAKVFLDRSASIMSGANMQRIVFGKGLSSTDTTTIENFYNDLYYENDLMVANVFWTSLYGFLIEQILVRGAIVARVLMRDKDGKFIPDISPVDSRYFLYDNDSQGIIWGAPFVTRSKAQIERDFGISINGRYAVVSDFWDDKYNDIYIASQLYTGGSQAKDPERHPARQREHGLGYPPYVFQKSGAGLSSLMDVGGLKFQGESIFAPNRGLIPELHRAASIFQTLTAMSFEGSYEYESKEGTEATVSEGPGLRKVIPVDQGGGYKLIQINDVKNATRLFYNMLVGALQRGGLPNIDYGNLSFPLSAVAITKLSGSKDAIFIPRLNAIALFFRAMSLMIKDQFIKGGTTVQLGREDIDVEYTVLDIDKKFSTKYEFHTVSPEQDIANTAAGQQQLALGMPRRYIYENTLKVNDVEGLINEGRDEKLEEGDIAITLNRRLKSLADKDGKFDKHLGKDIEAEMVLQQLEMVLRDRAQGGTMGLAPARGGAGARQSTKPLLNLFDKGGGGGGRQSQGDATLREPDEDERRSDRRETTVRRNTSEV